MNPLNAENSTENDDHLKLCPDCKKLHDDLQSSPEFLEAMKRSGATPEQFDTLWRQISEQSEIASALLPVMERLSDDAKVQALASATLLVTTVMTYCPIKSDRPDPTTIEGALAVAAAMTKLVALTIDHNGGFAVIQEARAEELKARG